VKYRVTDIEKFVAASSCATLSQAAVKLEVSQPALSQSILRLEADLGTLLFYRSRSGIRLTPSGRAFLTAAQNAVQALHELDRADRDQKMFGDRSISIGCHPLVAQYSLPRALLELSLAAPDYRVELRHDLSRNIQVQVQRGDLDVGIVVNPTVVPDLVIRKLGFDHVRVWTAGKQANRDTVVCDLNLFQTQSILKKWKQKPRKLISTTSLELVCRLAGAGLGYGIIPQRVVEVMGSALTCIAALPVYKDEICLVHRPELGRLPAERLVIDAIQQSFRSPALRQTESS
jgi:DNA-binding transcriptional LysR family regulator